MADGINKLTDKRLKSLLGTPREREFKVSDGAGLMIRVSKAGAMSWFYKYRIGGRDSESVRLNLGKYPDLSLKQARDVRDRCRSWLAEGKDPKLQLNLATTESLRPVTVKGALQYWINEYAEDNRANVGRHKAQLEKHIYPYIGDMALSDCETRYWLQCFDRMKKTTPVAAGYVFQMCKQALKYCRVRRYAISNALDDLTIPDVGKKQARKDRVLTDKEIGSLWRVVSNGGEFQPYYSNLLTILIVFGCRSQEARLSTCNEWDLESNLWTVPKEHSKTHERIIRPIPTELIPFIERLKKERESGEYLLGELKRTEAVSQWGRAVWKRLGHTEEWTLHDLRRSLATKLNDLGVGPHVVEQLLGHALPGIMAIYNRSQYLPEKLDALNKWLERLDVLAENHENVIILKVSRK